MADFIVEWVGLQLLVTWLNQVLSELLVLQKTTSILIAGRGSLGHNTDTLSTGAG